MYLQGSKLNIIKYINSPIKETKDLVLIIILLNVSPKLGHFEYILEEDGLNGESEAGNVEAGTLVEVFGKLARVHGGRHKDQSQVRPSMRLNI